LVLLSRHQAVAKFSQGLDLLKYLLPVFRDNPQTLNHDDFNWELADLINSTNGCSAVALVDVVRTILLPTKESSFELTNLCFIYLYITLDGLESPMSTCFTGTDLPWRRYAGPTNRHHAKRILGERSVDTCRPGRQENESRDQERVLV
jgi:hypothetical protein